MNMKEPRSLMQLTAIAVLTSVLVLAGCGQDGTKPTTPLGEEQQGVNMSDPMGGFTATNESPGFGDENLIGSVTQEEQIQDPVAQDPMVRMTDQGRSAKTEIYAMTILWGMLQDAGPAGSAGQIDGDQYDWSGSFSMSRGAVVLRSVVSFERGDHMVLPRMDRRTVQWVSRTKEGFDGIRLLLYIPDQDEGSPDDTLTFRTGLYSRSFSIGDLQQLDDLVTVDADGNRVHFEAFLTQPSAQTQGFLRGSWAPIPEGAAVGWFKGLWVGDHGQLSGFVRGYYGTNNAGEKVFFGKCVDTRGVFQGILRGNWDANPGGGVGSAGGLVGWFKGAWIDDLMNERGEVRGRWHTGLGRRGYFEGRCCLGCTFPSGNGANL